MNWLPLIFGVAAFAGFIAVVVLILRRERAERQTGGPFASGDDYPHENVDGEGR